MRNGESTSHYSMFTEELNLHTRKQQPLHNELKYSYVYMVLLDVYMVLLTIKSKTQQSPACLQSSYFIFKL
uniref:Uncharacterized protein n=1 Tax=Arundo donax TaxID=35708 RepID=A0A0A9GPY6_ARUDO